MLNMDLNIILTVRMQMLDIPKLHSRFTEYLVI